MQDDEAFRQDAKAMMRRRFRALRRSIPRVALAARSASACERLLCMQAVEQSRCVALFWPIEKHHEIDLRAADAALRAKGIAIAYPAIEAEALVFRLVDDLAVLERGDGMLKEPPADAPFVERIDLIAVPGIAFDLRGQRIGYGRGYYDRTLPRFARAVTVGVAFDFQLAAEVPNTHGDMPVDWIVTDRRQVRT